MTTEFFSMICTGWQDKNGPPEQSSSNKPFSQQVLKLLALPYTKQLTLDLFRYLSAKNSKDCKDNV